MPRRSRAQAGHETLILLLVFLALLAPATRAQMQNPAPDCAGTYVVEVIMWDPLGIGSGDFRRYCIDAPDYFPACPSSGASGNAGPASGGGAITGRYIPPAAQAQEGIGSAAEEMARAGALAAEAAAAAGESGDGCCGGGSGAAMTQRWHGNPGGPGGPGGAAECCEEGGMAFWWVSEPHLNVFLRDKPFFYNTSRGREVAFELHYKNTAGTNGLIDNIQHGIFSAGTNWHLPWRSYLQAVPGTSRYYGFLGDGSARQYLADQVDPASRATLIAAANNQFHLRFPSGSTNIYGTWITISNNAYCFLSAKVDLTGATTTFSYSSNNGTVLLTNVADVDGRNTTFVYTNNGYYSTLLSG